MYLIGAETILFCAFSVILEVSRLSCSQNVKVSIWVWDGEWNWPRPLMKVHGDLKLTPLRPTPTVHIVNFVVIWEKTTQGFYMCCWCFLPRCWTLLSSLTPKTLAACLTTKNLKQVGWLFSLLSQSLPLSHSPHLLPHPLLPFLHPFILPLYPFCLPPHPFTFSYPLSAHLPPTSLILLPHPVCFPPRPFTFSSIPYLHPPPPPSFPPTSFIPLSILSISHPHSSYTWLCAIFFSFDTFHNAEYSAIVLSVHVITLAIMSTTFRVVVNFSY